MFDFLIPKEYGFFEVFDRHAATLVEGSKLLVETLDHFNEVTVKVRRLKETEHAADEITHHTLEMLHKTFITPIDRDQIHNLISTMDDVIDYIDGAARRLILYGVTEVPADLLELAKILHRATLELQRAVGGLKNLKNAKAILASCIEINKLENDGDTVRDAAIAKLFREEKDAVKVLVWKEIYEGVETAIDRCEDVANIIEGVVLENA
jgi:predicted phosphate transport protein (TIGR00153 family)